MSFCSKIQLVCPVDGCNTAVPYLEFDKHKKRCLELSMQKMTLKSHAEISARNEMLSRLFEASKNKIKKQKKQISSLEAKICCKDEKIVSMEKMYNDQKDLLKIIRKDHKELSDKKIVLEERYSEVKKENFEYEKEARTRNETETSALNKSLTKELEELKMKIRDDESRRRDQKKQIATLEAKIRSNNDKTLSVEKMYHDVKGKLAALTKKKSYVEDCLHELKKNYSKYRKEAEQHIADLEETIEFSDKDALGWKNGFYNQLHDCKILKEENEKYKKLLEQKIRENFKLQQNHSHCKEQAWIWKNLKS